MTHIFSLFVCNTSIKEKDTVCADVKIQKTMKFLKTKGLERGCL
jgi:hypothetical protein